MHLKRDLKHPLLDRLMHYYYFVRDREAETVTSTDIAQLVHMDDTLVRKDLASIGVRGFPRVGFRSEDILQAISRLLGFDAIHRAAIVGTGRMGGALASYKGFQEYGVEICAAFDTAPQKVGQIIGTFEIRPLAALPQTVREMGIDIAILTVPAPVAQEVATLVVQAGVKALWNFAGTHLRVPEDIYVRHEHLAVGLAELSYRLKQASEMQAE